MKESVKLTADERRLLISHTAPRSRWSYDLVGWMLGFAITTVVVVFGIVPFGYLVSSCSAESSYEDELMAYHTWLSLETGECRMDDASRCKQLLVAQKLAPHVEEKDFDDVFYSLVSDALLRVNDDLFSRNNYSEANRNFAIDVINHAKVVPADNLVVPESPDITPTPWITLMIWAGCLLSFFNFVQLLYVRRQENKHVEWLAEPMIGLDSDLRSSYLDLLRKEVDMRALISQAPREDDREMQKLRRRAEELRTMLRGVRDQQTVRDRAARDLRISEIGSALQQICADAQGRLAYSRQQTEGVVSKAEVARSV